MADTTVHDWLAPQLADLCAETYTERVAKGYGPRARTVGSYLSTSRTVQWSVEQATADFLANNGRGLSPKSYCGRRGAYPTTDLSGDAGAMSTYPQSTYGTGG